MRFSLLRARTRLLHLPSKWNKLVVGGGGHRAFASSVPPASAAPTSSGSANYIRWFKNLSMEDLPEVGGKNASLGEMCQTLTELGVRVPDGFALTAPAYTAALDGLGLRGEGEGLGEGEGTSSSSSSAWTELHSLLDGLNKTDARALSRAGAKARELVFHCPMPAVVEKQLREAWRALKAERGEDLSVAVRSSATAEDLPGASFAGQHDTYLNIQGEEALITAVKKCQASLFTDRAISYRIDNNFDWAKVSLSVGIQEMVRSDLASSGVMFSIDTESGHPDMVFVTGAWGLGENVVQGAVDPDEFYVHKPTFRNGYRCVLTKALGEKQVKMIYSTGSTREPVVNRPTPRADRRKFCLSDHEVLVLADAAIKIEDHYSSTLAGGERRPMDIEWAKDGPSGKLYIVQARPETGQAHRSTNKLFEEFVVDKPAVDANGKSSNPVRVTGRAVGARIATGKVRKVLDSSHLHSFKPGEVLVGDTTTPDWEPVLKTAAAIVTNRGGRTCHAAIVARELGIPAVVGAENASEELKDGETVTVSCAGGSVGTVYGGIVSFTRIESDVEHLQKPKHTKINVILGSPELAFKVSQLPFVDGVGLARMEFIINDHIKVHPMAAVYPGRVADFRERAKVIKAFGAMSGPDFFVHKLAEGVGTIAAAFYPRPVIVRLSDFKTNEYASLLGGKDFEVAEENPMLGFRGAARYVHPNFAEAFALECKALRRVREDMGLSNLKLMVPFCRTLGEARAVLKSLAENGLVRGENGLEVYVMCEIPNNVLLIDEFSELFDGFSIGSNDLTQLTLGVDRDSAIVSDSFDEQDPGMLKMLTLAVEGAKRNGKPVGICGQAPSDHPEVARFLVKLGIGSLSLTPDRVLKTMAVVRELEEKAAASKKVPSAPPSFPPPTHKAQHAPLVEPVMPLGFVPEEEEVA